MLTPSKINGAAQSRPLTHRDYLAACAKAGAEAAQAVRARVQVRKRFLCGPVVLCGSVGELRDSGDGREWFKVATDIGTLWAEGRNVRLCSGDGRCTCEAT